MKDIQTNPSDIKLAEAPPGFEGPGFFATSLDRVVGLARKNSIWPLPFATSCCGIEFMATMASHYDFARFGSETFKFFSTPGRPAHGHGNHCKENGTGSAPGLRTNGRTTMGIVCRRLCFQRRNFRFLSRAAGYRSHHSCRCLCSRLPAKTRTDIGWCYKYSETCP